jgi:hypothetical protein
MAKSYRYPLQKKEVSRHPITMSRDFTLVAVGNWQGATTEFRAHRDALTKRHVCTPTCTPRGCKPCTPLVNN